jgi:hypothetical protein
MKPPRFFVMFGGADPGDLFDRASEHGEPVRAVAHPAPRLGCYGAVEINPFGPHAPKDKCAHAWEPHLWEAGTEYCPYCTSTRPAPRDGEGSA